jgi:RimJ/RimL family protein N-acetyltransferase
MEEAEVRRYPMIQLETERLIIRNYQEKDIDDYHEYMSLEITSIHENFNPLTYAQCRDLVMQRIHDDRFSIVELKSERKCIGDLYYQKRDYEAIEIGYDFNMKYWKKGYATEACQALVHYLFCSLNARRVIAECNEGNEDSIQLLERLGFRREGLFIEDVSFKQDKYGNPVYVNSLYYAILRRDFVNGEKRSQA